MMQVLWRIPIRTAWFPDGIPIYGFGMMLFLAFLLCTWMTGRRAEKEGISRELIQDLAIYIFLGGLLGARLTYLLQQERELSLWELIRQLPRIWDGGIILYGSVLGGLAGYCLAWLRFLRKQQVSTLKIADILAPAITVGLCLGRLGCFLNGCCYGQVVCAECQAYPVHFPLSAPARYALVDTGMQTAAGFTLLPAARQDEDGAGGVRIGQVDPTSPAYAAGLRPGDVVTAVDGHPVASSADLHAYLGDFRHWPRGKSALTLEIQGRDSPLTFTPRTLGLHPTQLYETISMFLLFLVLIAFYPLRTRDGQVMALLMIGYAVHRYLNELLRSDPRPVGFEKYGSLLLLVAGAALFLWLLRRPAQYRLQWSS